MTECDECDLLCIGSGPAGQHAAIQAAKLDKRAAVVERRRTVGGVCVDTGTILRKTICEVVRYIPRRAPVPSIRGLVQAIWNVEWNSRPRHASA